MGVIHVMTLDSEQKQIIVDWKEALKDFQDGRFTEC